MWAELWSGTMLLSWLLAVSVAMSNPKPGTGGTSSVTEGGAVFFRNGKVTHCEMDIYPNKSISSLNRAEVWVGTNLASAHVVANL